MREVGLNMTGSSGGELSGKDALVEAE